MLFSTRLAAFGGVLGVAKAAADSDSGAWSDFTNNFATDIAPLITLFGEQVTKQFLSESSGFLDNIIFGMAPLGIITAVVSAIRVYGWPGLKAFVGRAQEPHGVAEAELCSSTSRDVCELWSEGGICRVFGRPKILEFFHKYGKDDFYPRFEWNTTERGVEEPGACNIYRPVCSLGSTRCCFMVDQVCSGVDDDWKEKSSKSPSPQVIDSLVEIGALKPNFNFAPFPNLSLNIGIRTTPKWVLVLVATFGSLLQLSLFGYATVITFYREDLYAEAPGTRPATWSFVLAVLGTAMVVIGMILCAFLIDHRSQERRFCDGGKESAEYTSADTTMFWLQPGNQRIGDQQFNAFSYSQVKHSYITSWKSDHNIGQLGSRYVKLVLVLALFFSVIGFVLQFVGLRGLHGSVALYQIAATIFMSAVRALLRLRRLGPDDNKFSFPVSVKEGHELDWQAMATFSDRPGRWRETPGHSPQGVTTAPGGAILDVIKEVISWRMSDDKISHGMSKVYNSGLVKHITPFTREDLYGESLHGFYLPNQELRRGEVVGWSTCLDCAREAVAVAKWYEGVYDESRHDKDLGYVGPNPVAMIALVRSRFAFLTGDGVLGVQPKWDGFARIVGQELQLAIQGIANYVFSSASNMALKDHWKDVLAMTWHTTAAIECFVSVTATVDGEEGLIRTLKPMWLSFPMFRYGSEWKISRHKLEAVVSLWASSYFDGSGNEDDADDPNDKILLVGTSETAAVYSTLRLWMPDTNLRLRENSLSLRLPAAGAWVVKDKRLLSREQMDRTPAADRQGFISMRAKSVGIKLLAQNILTIFISRVVDTMHTVDTPDEELLTASGLPNSLSEITGSSERLLGLSNAHIKAFAKVIVDSGLGTEEEALMCVVPVFVQAGILPREDKVRETLLRLVRKLRREGQFPRAEAVAVLMLDNSNPTTRSAAVRELGEVYRKASGSSDGLLQQWGLQGLWRLANLWNLLHPRSEKNRDCRFDLEDEGDMKSMAINGWPVRYTPAPDELSFMRRYGHLYGAIYDHRRTTRNWTFLLDHLQSRGPPSSDHEWAELLQTAATVDFSAVSDNGMAELALMAVKGSLRSMEISPPLDCHAILFGDLLESRPGLVEKLLNRGWRLQEAMGATMDIQIMKTILDLGEVRITSPYTETGEMVLTVAIRERRTDIVRLLLDRGAPIDRHVFEKSSLPAPQGYVAPDLAFLRSLTSTDGVALHTAIGADLTEVVGWLLERGDCNVNVRIVGALEYAINIACFLGREEVLSLLLADGRVDIEIAGWLGTPLAIACAAGETEIAKALLARGAKVSHAEGLLGQPLVVACLQGHYSIVEELLKAADADPNVVGVAGMTALCAAVRSPTRGAPEAKSLIQHGADVNLAGSQGTTPLLAAITGRAWGEDPKDEDFEAITALLEAGADPDRRSGEELGCLSPLEICLLEDLYHVPKALAPLLKRHGARVDDLSSTQVEQWRRREHRPELGQLRSKDLEVEGPEGTVGGTTDIPGSASTSARGPTGPES